MRIASTLANTTRQSINKGMHLMAYHISYCFKKKEIKRVLSNVIGNGTTITDVSKRTPSPFSA